MASDPNSIVDYLKSSGKDSSLSARMKLGKEYGIDYGKTTDNYATQNIALLNALRGKSNTGSAVSQITPANVTEKINENQNTDFNNASKKNDVPTKTSKYSDIVNQVTSTLTKGLGDKPETINLADTYKKLREDQGVNDLETNLSSLQGQARDLMAISKARTDAEKAKPVAMNVIAGRVSEEERQDQERLTAINNSIQTITSQLQTKYSAIDTIMKYTGQDYSNAVDAYDKQFSQNLQVMNMAKGIIDTEKDDAERETDNARANLQIIYNNIPSDGITDATQKANISKLELQAGLPQGFYENVTNSNPKADILSTTTRESNGTKYADVIIRNDDGSLSTKTITLGSATGGGNETEGEKKAKAFGIINQLIDRVDADGTPYTDGSGYFTAKGFKTLVKNAAEDGVSRAEFIAQYGDYLNPDVLDNYGLTAKEKVSLGGY
jgi:hypothetical protein